jgi:subtilisin family serine protease
MNGPIMAGWKERLAQAGADIFDYVPDYAFITRMTPDVAKAVAGLPFVRTITPYLPAYKIDPHFGGATGTISATVSLFPGVDSAAFISGARSRGLQARANGGFVTVTGDALAVRLLANEDGARWIEASPRTKLTNSHNRPVLGVDRVWKDFGLYGEGQVIGFLDTGLDLGNPKTVNQDFQGKVIAGMGLNQYDDWSDRVGHGTHVAGTLAGLGILSGSDPDLKKFDRSFAGVAPLASLVVQEVDVDPNTGRSVGLDAQTDLGPILDFAYQKGARIHNNSWGDDDIPDGTYSLHAAQVDRYIWEHPDLAVFFAAGNSGSDSEYQKKYIEKSQELQAELNAMGSGGDSTAALTQIVMQCFLGGAGLGDLGGLSGGSGADIDCLLSGDPDACDTSDPGDASSDPGDSSSDPASGSDICTTMSDIQTLQQQAADNSPGVIQPGSINSPGTAKNVVTVGASEGNLPPTDHDYKCSDQDTSQLDLLGGLFGGGSASASLCSYEATGFPADPFASDDMSDNINGMAAFSSRGPTLDGRIKPDLVAPGTRIISDRSALGQNSVYWATYDAHYAYAGGTSQATPMAAGSAALVREWLQKKRGVSAPSAALIKGLLINGAHDMTPGQYGTGATQEIGVRPNIVEGWGRVDLAATMDSDTRTTLFTDETTGLSTGATQRYVYNVKVGTPLSLTLSWSDYPGSPTAGKALVNDLNLVVTGPDGQALQGNGKTDDVNNVEGLDIAAPADGTYTVEVQAANVPNGPQPYALVVSGAVSSATAGKNGDVNGDGKVTTADVVLALRAAVGSATLTADQKAAADVAPAGNPDGIVNVTDAMLLLRVSVGLAAL